jgi:hypothetical protein
MAFDPAPTEVIASWSEDGTNVTFPIASVPELTAAEADASTGDSRKVLYALMEAFYAWYNGLAPADRPAQLQLFRSSTAPNETTGLITRTFTARFVLDPGPLEVAAEA